MINDGDAIALHHGDCLEKLKEIPPFSVDMVLVDLPYGTTACKWDSIIPFEPMWHQLKQVCKQNAPIVMTASQPFTTALIASNLKAFKYCWVWEKNCPSNIACASFQPMKYTEDIVVFQYNRGTFNKQMIPRSEAGSKAIRGHQAKGTPFRLGASNISSITSTQIDPNRYDVNLKNPSNLIYFRVERGKKHKHPTQKPLALMEYLIKTYTNENETVLDFTMGSGTTGVACVNLHRVFIGIELEKTYFDIALDRIDKAINEGGLW